MERIDAFGHFVLRGLYEAVDYGNGKPSGLDKDPADHVSDMDEFGVDKQIISQQPVSMWDGIGPEEALPLTRLANDEIREMADRFPQRLFPVATLPFLSGDYLDELERCIDELGMVGVQIFSNVNRRPIDSEEFRKFFRTANRERIPIWLHPKTGWSDWANIDGYSLEHVYGYPAETSLAMTRLVLSDIMSRFQNLDIVCHHMGGMTAHFIERLRSFYEWWEEDDEPYSLDSLDEDIRRFYPDTARQSSPDVLENGYTFFGRENLVYGTDYPFGPEGGRRWMEEEIIAIEAMNIPEENKENIFSGNIKSIVDI